MLFDRLNINEGMIIENVVAQMLRFNGHKLYFYSRNDVNNRKNHIEIDFLIAKDRKIVPIEVKSSNYRYHTSLDKFTVKFNQYLGEKYIIYTNDLMIKDGIIHIPVYMTIFL